MLVETIFSNITNHVFHAILRIYIIIFTFSCRFARILLQNFTMPSPYCIALQETITQNMLSYQLNIMSYHIYTIHTRTIIFVIYSYSIPLSKLNKLFNTVLIFITDSTCSYPTSVHNYVKKRHHTY